MYFHVCKDINKANQKMGRYQHRPGKAKRRRNRKWKNATDRARNALRSTRPRYVFIDDLDCDRITFEHESDRVPPPLLYDGRPFAVRTNIKIKMPRRDNTVDSDTISLRFRLDEADQQIVSTVNTIMRACYARMLEASASPTLYSASPWAGLLARK